MWVQAGSVRRSFFEADEVVLQAHQALNPLAVDDAALREGEREDRAPARESLASVC